MIADWTFVYREDDERCHIKELLYSAHEDSLDAEPEETWLGTGSQEEWEKARKMPVCPECMRVRLLYKETRG